MTHQVQPGAESRNQLWSWGVLENSGGKRKSLGKLPVTTVTTLTLPARMLPKKNMLTLLEKSLYSTHVSRKALGDLGGIEWHCMAVHLPACNTSSNMFWTHVYNTFRNCSLVLLAMSCLTHQSSRRQKACGANMVSLSTWKRYLTRKKTFRNISGYLKQTIELLSSNRTSPYFSIVQGSPSGRAKFLDLMLPESSTNKVFLPRIQFECKLKIYQNLGHKSLNVEVDWVDRIKQKGSKTYEVPKTSIVTGFESIHSVPGPEQSSNKWGKCGCGCGRGQVPRNSNQNDSFDCTLNISATCQTSMLNLADLTVLLLPAHW